MLQEDTVISTTPSLPTPFDDSSSAGYENEEDEIYLINEEIETEYVKSKSPLMHSGFHEISFFANDSKPLQFENGTNQNLNASPCFSSSSHEDEFVESNPEFLLDSFQLQFQHYLHLADLAIQCISFQSNSDFSDSSSLHEPRSINEYKDDGNDDSRNNSNNIVDWTEQIQKEIGYEE